MNFDKYRMINAINLARSTLDELKMMVDESFTEDIWKIFSSEGFHENGSFEYCGEPENLEQFLSVKDSLFKKKIEELYSEYSGFYRLFVPYDIILSCHVEIESDPEGFTYYVTISDGYSDEHNVLREAFDFYYEE